MVQEEYNPEAVEAFAKAGRPIPGQSLTSNPEEVRPFEGAPEFTNFKEALDYTVGELLEEEAYMSIVGAIGDGVPVIDLVMQITYVGFREGKWNPDLMLMLLEPFAYLLMALAEKAGVKYRIDSDDVGANLDMDDGVADEEEAMLVDRAKNVARVAASKKARESGGGVPEGALPQEVIEKIEALPELGLLDRQPEIDGDAIPSNDSLLARGEEE